MALEIMRIQNIMKQDLADSGEEASSYPQSPPVSQQADRLESYKCQTPPSFQPAQPGPRYTSICLYNHCLRL
jgi:hypothetical protein